MDCHMGITVIVLWVKVIVPQHFYVFKISISMNAYMFLFWEHFTCNGRHLLSLERRESQMRINEIDTIYFKWKVRIWS